MTDAEFMINFDMVGRISGPRFIAGDSAFATLASTIARELGHDIPPGKFPINVSSDHVSFSNKGVPAITVHSGGDKFIHTAQDNINAVFFEDLAIFLKISTKLLRTLLDVPSLKQSDLSRTAH